MKWNRMRSYWLVLLAMMLMLSSVLSVNQTQARYNTTAVWNTVVSYEAGLVTSNCLSQEKPVILLGKLPLDGSEVTFTLESAQEVAAPLTWSCDKEEYLEVSVYLDKNGAKSALKQGDSINLPEGNAVTVVMTLLPTSEALTAPRNETEINVSLSCGDLGGTFRMALPAIEPEETAEPTEAEETTAPTDPEETTAPTEPEETTAPAEAAALAVEAEENTLSEEDQTDGSDAGESGTEPQADLLSDQEETDNSLTITPLELETIRNFDSAAMLPVTVKTTGNSQKLLLGMASEMTDGEVDLIAFPAFTRYCWNGGNYLLYHSGLIEIDIGGQEETSLLLDFSGIGVNSGGKLILGAQAYRDDEITEAGTVDIYANVDSSDMEIPRFLTTQLTAEKIPAEGTSFTIDLPVEWIDDDLVFEYEIQMLTFTQTGTAYRDVQTDGQSLTAQYIRDEETRKHSVTVDISDQLAPAGTYRLNMSFSYKGICFREVQTMFYIYYTSIT